jgi:hypothetical protein
MAWFWSPGIFAASFGFDEKGGVTGIDPWQWFVWQTDGTYVPLEPSP